MSKTITIDEDLFTLPSKGGSRKKRAAPKENIKIKSSQAEKPKSLKRNHILKFIREQQEKNYKKLLEGDPNIKRDKDFYKEDFHSSFDDTLDYLMDLAEREKTNPSLPATNRTLKQRHHENVSLAMPSSLQDFSNSLRPLSPTLHRTSSPSISLSSPIKTHSPSWGCLKNGSLPTYRNWKTSTQKVPLEETIMSQSLQPSAIPSIPHVIHNPVLREIQEKRLQQQREKGQTNVPKMEYVKQKRTVRRTYKVGRDKHKPKIAVLVSNRTMRNRITTENQLLKQTPLDEVRKYLVKKGFIKVGSSAPNDVLRKMHETAKLMCGEMENHNPDNLLYNYFHNSDQ